MTEPPPPATGTPQARAPAGMPVDRWMRPLLRFLEIEAASGVVLLACTLGALIAANTDVSDAFHRFWETRIGIFVGPLGLELSLHHWVNDGLMTIFFFVVGLEIKREVVAGELRDPRRAALPLAAALGGMVVPAGIYLALQLGGPAEAGWGIPMATDIAFVVGFLALLGKRVPHGLKIFLLSVAIADDLGAVLVIAVGYSQGISPLALALGFAGLGLCAVFNRIGVRRVPIYLVIGSGVWLAFLHSGVHATVAGVLLGLLTPATAWVGDRGFLEIVEGSEARLRGERTVPGGNDRGVMMMELANTARETIPPLNRLETLLHPWVAFGIMPVFALANAGVHFAEAEFLHPVGVAVALGLVVGKPVGIFAASWLSVRLGLARLPAGVDWPVIVGAGCLAGIGFTMALFIAGLALDGALLEASKLGILSGSAVSAILGSALLLRFLPRRSPNATAEASRTEPVSP